MDVKKLAEQSGAHRVYNEAREEYLTNQYEYAFTEEALKKYTTLVIKERSKPKKYDKTKPYDVLLEKRP